MSSVNPYDPDMNRNKLNDDDNRRRRVDICRSILCVIFIILILSIVFSDY